MPSAFFTPRTLMRLGSASADRRSPAQHNARGPRRDTPRPAALAARTARFRRRRHRVRRPRARLVGPALQADGQPVPLRPARVRDAAHQRMVAGQARRAHIRGPPADGHGVLVRGHRVDPGRRGRAPPALAGAGDLLRVPRAPAGVAQRPPRQRLPGVADQGPRRAAQGREVGLLERGRRPVQGLARLRRAAVGGVRARGSSAGPRSVHRPSAPCCPTVPRERSSRCIAAWVA